MSHPQHDDEAIAEAYALIARANREGRRVRAWVRARVLTITVEDGPSPDAPDVTYFGRADLRREAATDALVRLGLWDAF